MRLNPLLPIQGLFFSDDVADAGIPYTLPPEAAVTTRVAVSNVSAAVLAAIAAAAQLASSGGINSTGEDRVDLAGVAFSQDAGDISLGGGSVKKKKKKNKTIVSTDVAK